MTVGPITVAPPRILWPRPGVPAAPRALILSAAAAGLVTASVAVTPLPGIGAAIGIIATTAAVWPFTRGRRNAELLGWGACAVVLSLVVVVRDAPWLVNVDLAASLGLASIALAKPRTLVAHVVAGAALFLAGLKGARWMAVGVRTMLGGRSMRVKPWLRSMA
ncbi:MAG: hypothetical protein QOG52_410, partial [Frankiaceae bacterium]|nr:hypothetical protein [Frankiaceae bacterium]